MVYKDRSSLIFSLSLTLIVLLGFGLRFFGHDLSPPGFTADEAVFGYNAYSLLKTGRDEFGTKLPVALRAFGDYRPALYSYLAVPFVSSLGLTETATRLPSILAGTVTILVAAILGWLVTENKLVAGAAAIVVATSPTQVLISRFADMSTLSALFLALGVVFYLSWWRLERPGWLWASAMSFVLAVYSYHNARLTGLLLLLALSWLSGKRLKRNIKPVMVTAGFGLVILLPLIFFLARSPEQTLRRGRYESFLSQGGYQIRLWNLVSSNPPDQHPWLTRFFHNKPKIILEQFLENYLSHFSPNFLFWKGDLHERFQTPGSGVYNLTLFLLTPVGLVVLGRKKETAIIPLWVLFSPLVASLGLFTPNSLHTLDSLVPMAVLAGVGVSVVERRLGRLGMIGLIGGIYLWSLGRFLTGYFVTIPRDPELRWNWYPQTRDLVAMINQVPEDEPVTVVGNKSLHQFILFYNRIDPSWYQQAVKVSDLPDENGFERVEEFGKFRFVGQIAEVAPYLGQLVVFDRDSLESAWFWQAVDCQLETDKPFAQVKGLVETVDGEPLYYLADLPENQEAAIDQFCGRSG